jgi:hypothetical protein
MVSRQTETEGRAGHAHLYLSYLVEDDNRGETVPELATEVPTLGNGGIMASGKFQMAYDAWWFLGNDPDDAWNVSCDEFPPRGLNVAFWCNRQGKRAT